MKDFVYVSQPQRVVFGAGSLNHLAREIDALGARRALVLCTPEQRASAEQVEIGRASCRERVYSNV